MHSSFLLAIASAFLIAASSSGAAYAATDNCGELTPPPSTSPTTSRQISVNDLVRLRDIGQNAPAEPTSPIALSPDGRSVAFQLRRLEPTTNQVCLGMYVLNIAGTPHLINVDRGGDFMLAKSQFDGKTMDILNGYPQAIAPKWAPNGNEIAYLRRDDGLTRLWIAQADGSGARAVSPSATDIADFAWTRTGDELVVEIQRGLESARKTIVKEALTGFHFDERYTPMDSTRPVAVDDNNPAFIVLSLSTRQQRPANHDEIELLQPAHVHHIPANATQTGAGPVGRYAWIVQPNILNRSSTELWATDPKGRPVRCTDAACQGGMTDIWWSSGDKAITYFRREGWAQSQIGVYRWVPGHAPRRTLVTNDVLMDCQAREAKLICLEESSTRPRHLVLLDPRTGRRQLLFDPNPEFSGIRLGTVERLHWHNDIGFETVGDLVLPPDYHPGERLPLIVVQYSTRGFLRGGTGHEFPIQLYAAHGFAVLSFSRPDDYGVLTNANNPRDFFRADLQDFADRRSVLSALETGVQLLIDRGLVDPARVGLTGLSDGAATVQFAILHSHMFAAFATTECCMDRDDLAYPGKYMADLYRYAGYPLISDPAPDFAKNYFISANAGRINTPILVQVSDHEVLAGLSTITALRELNKPIDTYVFPDEYHIKWQPAHRAASYLRSLQWFDFWLCGREDPKPIDPTQYSRWKSWEAALPDKADIVATRRPNDPPMPPHLPARAGEGNSSAAEAHRS